MIAEREIVRERQIIREGQIIKEKEVIEEEENPPNCAGIAEGWKSRLYLTVGLGRMKE